MRVICETLTDARLAAAAARQACREASRFKRHDGESCACPHCHAGRLFTEAVGKLGEVPADEAGRAY